MREISANRDQMTHKLTTVDRRSLHNEHCPFRKNSYKRPRNDK